MSSYFQFKQFKVAHDKSAMKVGTDGVLLGTWTTPFGKSILDIGTGTGLIALILAQRNQKAIIDAVEVNAAAATQAEENFKNSPWHNRLSCYPVDINNFYPDRQYDLIISNPPYFSRSTPAPDEKRQQARHAASLTHENLIYNVARLLAPSGKFSVILPARESIRLKTLAENKRLFPEKVCQFIPREGKEAERILVTFSRIRKEIEQERLFHYTEGNQWSEAYINLTRDFYTVL